MSGSAAGALKAAAARIGITPDEYAHHQSVDEKWCHSCRSWKAKGEFVIDRSRGDGLSAECCGCRNKRHMPGPSRRERHFKAADGLTWCRGCEAWLPSVNVRSGQCQTHANSYARQRYASNTDFRNRRRAHVRRHPRTQRVVPRDAEERMAEDFGGRCAYCAAPATSYDHIVPVVAGGMTTPGNIVPACASCNASKRGRDVDDWVIAHGLTPCDAFFERLDLADSGLYG